MAAEADVATDRDRTLVMERIFNAPPERVFKAWTDPKILAQWWGNDEYRASAPYLDLRVGGAWQSPMAGPNGEVHTVSGVYRLIDPPRRLVMTWAWEQADGSRGHETILEITLEPAGAGTRLKLVQGVFADSKQRDGHDFGWQAGFNRLGLLLAG
jgi:uncharacterized protein YndB with AHSA1/START domain